jgi:DNA-binding MarR family transcriptional regulator
MTSDALAETIADREMSLLEQIEYDPDVTQASLATQLGVAVGTVNWHIRRLVEKGYVKVKRAQRRKLRYIITPEGLAFRALLTVNYIETSMRLYRHTRQRVRELLAQVSQAGYDQVILDVEGDENGDGSRSDSDIADICRLTCLEQHIRVIDPRTEGSRQGVPVLEVRGTKVYLNLEA